MQVLIAVSLSLIATRCAAAVAAPSAHLGGAALVHPVSLVLSGNDQAANAPPWIDRPLPRGFGLPVTQGDTMYIDISHGNGHQRLMEVRSPSC